MSYSAHVHVIVVSKYVKILSTRAKLRLHEYLNHKIVPVVMKEKKDFENKTGPVIQDEKIFLIS